MDYIKYSIEDLLNDDSFLNYCAGSNASDTAFWGKILMEHPDLREKAQEAKKLALLMGVRVDTDEKNQALARLKSAMASERSSTTKRILPMGWWAAAAAILLVGSLFFWWRAGEADHTAFASRLAQADFVLLAKTGFNERKEVTLADGTKVIMNGGSELRIKPGYNDQYRLLWLSGEAFFKVNSRKNVPFIVRTASSSTTVLGTSFKVKQEAGSDNTSVMLTAGKVMVNDLNGTGGVNKLVLNPGEMTLMDGKTLHKSTFQPSEMNDWLGRRLHFSAAGYAEIRQRLGDIYGVKLQVEGALARKLAFTGELAGLSLEEVMDAIAFANHCTFTLAGNEVLIK